MARMCLREEGRKQMRRLPEVGIWALLGVGGLFSPQDLSQWDKLGLSRPRGEQRVGGAKSRTGRC